MQRRLIALSAASFSIGDAQVLRASIRYAAQDRASFVATIHVSDDAGETEGYFIAPGNHGALPYGVDGAESLDTAFQLFPNADYAFRSARDWLRSNTDASFVRIARVREIGDDLAIVPLYDVTRDGSLIVARNHAPEESAA